MAYKAHLRLVLLSLSDRLPRLTLLLIAMYFRSLIALTFFALLSVVASLPAPAAESLDRRISITLPGSDAPIIDTGDDLSGLSELDPIPDGFLEGDSDTGGGSKQIGYVYMSLCQSNCH
jgi:hypothetical protein